MAENQALVFRGCQIVVSALGARLESLADAKLDPAWRSRLASHSLRQRPLDAHALLKLVVTRARELFPEHDWQLLRKAAEAALDARNAAAHLASTDVDDDVALRGLSGAAQVLKLLESPQTEEVRALMVRVYGGAASSSSTGSVSRLKPSVGQSSKISFDQAFLREHLVGLAKKHVVTTYGDVGKAFGHPKWSQGHTVALTTAMNHIAKENRRCNEPLLMALVVSKATGLPGQGFFHETGASPDDPASHQNELARIFAHAW